MKFLIMQEPNKKNKEVWQPSPAGEKVDAFTASLHNENLNINNRLFLFLYVTFSSINIHHAGFPELNSPYEYEVIENKAFHSPTMD